VEVQTENRVENPVENRVEEAEGVHEKEMTAFYGAWKKVFQGKRTGIAQWFVTITKDGKLFRARLRKYYPASHYGRGYKYWSFTVRDEYALIESHQLDCDLSAGEARWEAAAALVAAGYSLVDVAVQAV
jgi:hypothetical protein